MPQIPQGGTKSRTSEDLIRKIVIDLGLSWVRGIFLIFYHRGSIVFPCITEEREFRRTKHFTAVDCPYTFFSAIHSTLVVLLASRRVLLSPSLGNQVLIFLRHAVLTRLMQKLRNQMQATVITCCQSLSVFCPSHDTSWRGEKDTCHNDLLCSRISWQIEVGRKVIYTRRLCRHRIQYIWILYLNISRPT